MTRRLDFIISAALAAIAVGLFGTTFSESFDVPTFGGDAGPAFAPRGFLIVWFAMAVASAVGALRSTGDQPADRPDPGRLATVMAVAVLTGAGVVTLGFVFAAIPGFFLFCAAYGYRNWLVLAVLSVAGPLAIWALFTFGFELPLPRSPWFHRL
ncbi:MAG: tripartite tricarboxylate transporter TctB family protein [Paracoccaceae bacterium]|nr:tripartite tricarboxylate transporter TctB family protein [Paracoccaceae bacterium]MDE2913567.1 tripartite tricarboxylate transporter TctB family protein [Paracoccaceae bacterium]